MENNNLSITQLNLNDNVGNTNTNSKQTMQSVRPSLLNTQVSQPMLFNNLNGGPSSAMGGGGAGSVTSSLASNNSNSISSSLNSTFSTNIQNMNSAGNNMNSTAQQQLQQPVITISLTGSSENLTRIMDDDDNQTVSTYSEMGDN
jgi:hypothetical protein